MRRTVTLCSTCVRNIASPFVESSNGVCVYCQAFERNRERLTNNLKNIEGQFVSAGAEKRGRGRYDCLVMVSGGKDSIMALYKIKKETGLRPLAFTIDNGFEMDAAMANVKRATSLLGIDWILDAPAVMKSIIRTVLLERLPYSICRFCAPVMVNRAGRLAGALGIPYLVTGWNKGQSDREPSRHPLWNITERDFASLAERYPFMNDYGLAPGENDRLLGELGVSILSPWVCERRDPSRIMKVLEEELFWEAPETSYPRDSTSCKLNLLQVILSRHAFGYTHYDCEESMLVSYGERSRDEALRILDFDIDLTVVREVLGQLELKLEDLDLTPESLEALSHFK